MLSERPMDWTHRLFNRARSSRSQTLTDNQTVSISTDRDALFSLHEPLNFVFFRMQAPE